MVRLERLSINQSILYIRDYQFLFSYEKLVAARLDNYDYLVTETYYSPTTSKHINKFIGDAYFTRVSEDVLLKELQNAATKII